MRDRDLADLPADVAGPQRSGAAAEGEQIRTVRVSIDDAIAALGQNAMRNGPLLIALQWLALNRGRAAELLQTPR